MNIIQITARTIISKSFQLSVRTIAQFHDMNVYEQKIAALRKLPAGTLGRDIADCLDRHGLKLVPGYESHDLKHVLLDFKMTPVDEIRMQSFMLGNGNITFASMAIFTFGALLLPELWRTFYRDFKQGRAVVPVKTWTIEAYAHVETAVLRNYIQNNTRQAPVQKVPMTALVRFIAYAAVIAGITGMLFCLPFLFSSNLADLVGAGFPFVGGAIIAGAGLIALSNMAQKVRKEQVVPAVHIA